MPVVPPRSGLFYCTRLAVKNDSFSLREVTVHAHQKLASEDQSRTSQGQEVLRWE